MFRLSVGWLFGLRIVTQRYVYVYGYNRASPIFFMFYYITILVCRLGLIPCGILTNHRKWASYYRLIPFQMSLGFFLCVCVCVNVSHSFIHLLILLAPLNYPSMRLCLFSHLIFWCALCALHTYAAHCKWQWQGDGPSLYFTFGICI